MTIIETGAGIADACVREGLPGIRIMRTRRSYLAVVTSGFGVWVVSEQDTELNDQLGFSSLG